MLCGAVFKHVVSLKYHMANKVCTRPKRGEIKELKCPTCDKQFKGITAMDYHIKRKVCEQINPRRRISSTGPPYSCDWCGTLFNLKQTCYVHMVRKACIKFPNKYALKNKKHSLLDNLEVTLTEGNSDSREDAKINNVESESDQQ